MLKINGISIAKTTKIVIREKSSSGATYEGMGRVLESQARSKMVYQSQK